jgi:outer membrane protein assembly factor BamB
MLRRYTAGIGIFVLFALAGSAAEPVGWRNDGTGRFPSATPPTEWSREKNVTWKVALPGPSYGAPIVVGEHLFVASDPGDLLCVRRSDGKVLWQKSLADIQAPGASRGGRRGPGPGGFGPGGFGRPGGASQPGQVLPAGIQERLQLTEEQKKQLADLQKEIDGKLGTILTDEQKKQLKDMQQGGGRGGPGGPGGGRGGPGGPGGFGGMSGTTAGNSAATPVSDGKHVAAVFGNGVVAVYTPEGKRLWARFVEPSGTEKGNSASPLLFGDKLIVHLKDLVALDVASGKEVWRVALTTTHASPVAAQLGKEEIIVCPAGALVRARDGKVLVKGTFQASEGSPVVSGDILCVPDRDGLTAHKMTLSEDGQVTLTSLWRVGGGGKRYPSPLAHDGLLYNVNNTGILEVIDLKNGERVYRERLPLSEVYGSVALAGKLIYVFDTRGKAVVFKPGQTFERVAINQCEGTGCCPVFAGNQLYVRTQQALCCVSAAAKDEK